MSVSRHRPSRPFVSSGLFGPHLRPLVPSLPTPAGRRQAARALVAGALILGSTAMAGCATWLDRDPVQIDVVGIDPLESQSLEWRFAVRLRIQNPNQTPIEFDGAAVEIDVRGVRLGSGVSDQRGTIPRFGETLVTLPVTVPITALLRQGLAFARDPDGKTDYRVRGKLAGPLFGSTRFESRGEFNLPALLR